MTATPSHIPAPLASLVGAKSDPFDRRAGELIGQPPLRVAFVVTEPAAGTLRVDFSVLNQAGVACKGLFLLAVSIGTDAAGAPAGIQATTWNTGTVQKELTADKAWLIHTSADGVARLTMTGAGDRHVRAGVLAVMQGTGLVTFP